jgi:hypothetical protein
VNARQREFHREDLEPLTAIRAIIMGFVAAIHFSLELA